MKPKKTFRNAVPMIALTALVVQLVSGCGPAEPLPDHFGLFAVQAQSPHELVHLDPGDPAVNFDEGLDGFFRLYSKALVLDAPPDYLILYDQQFTPGNIHLVKMTPVWAKAQFTAPSEEIPLQVQPIADFSGMYRLRPQRPLDKGFYVASGEGSTFTAGNGYFGAICVQCAIDDTYAALDAIRAEEAARLNAATVPANVLAQSTIVFWYGPQPQSLSWTVTVTNTNISWTGFRSATIGYSEIQSVDLFETEGPWGGILCLDLPPRIKNCNNTVQVSTIKVLDEIPKLREVAEVAQVALAAWKQEFPTGLPYAVPE